MSDLRTAMRGDPIREREMSNEAWVINDLNESGEA